ncbi:MAG TPA: hypothetical protein VEA19_00565, partial [Actinomycetota bacterium]|nr:hypothetical protein [Actinomycetota bacterium]
MITPRGIAVLGGGLGLWFASRLIGVPDLHVVGVGMLALPAIAFAVVRLRRPVLSAHRRLGSRRVFPGNRVRVELEIRNDARSSTPVLLLDDRLP